MEDPAQAKGVVKREGMEVITPGTVAIEEFLSGGRGSALMPGEGGVGYALDDIIIGELLAGMTRPR